MTDAAPVTLRDAATVLLLRDGATGIEVFMLRRNLNSDFVGGAYVFPGGAVDPADRRADLEAVCEGRTDADASARIGVPSGGLAFWVAAIRESFEEAGVLLAYDADDDLVDLDQEADAVRWAAHRTAVDQGERRLVQVCHDEGLRLAVDGMHHVAHWITPEGAPRRYDTHFFLAAAPANQTALHDDHEVIANEWLRPADGIARVEAGELTMMPPTLACLRAIERFATTADALAAAERITDVPAILPRIVVTEGGGVRVAMPGDPDYDGDAGVPDRTIDWMRVVNARTTGLDEDPRPMSDPTR